MQSYTIFQKFGLSLQSVRSGGGIGRHAGLKIPWTEMSVRVRFPSGARGVVLKIALFYKSLIISTLLLSGFILCYLVLSKTACKFACK